MLNSLSYSPGAKLLENTMTTAKQQQQQEPHKITSHV